MAPQSLASMQQSPLAFPGTWRLAAGRAMTLEPREAGVLRVAHGRLWATSDGPHSGPLNDLGDRILGAGERVCLQAGERWVIEGWTGRSPAYFSWDPLPACATREARRLAPVTQPLRDLRIALVLGAGALVRLVAGLAAVGRELVGAASIIPAWRGRNHPSTTSNAMRSWT
jgi:hypothetical protein